MLHEPGSDNLFVTFPHPAVSRRRHGLYSRVMNARGETPERRSGETRASGSVSTRPTTRSVDRAISDVRRGLPVVVTGAGAEFAVAFAAEQATGEALAWLANLGAGRPTLAITAERAAVLRIPPTGANVTILKIGDDPDPAIIRNLSDPTADLANPLRGPFPAADAPPTASVAASVELCKLAKLLPAAVTTSFTDGGRSRAEAFSAANDLLMVAAEGIAGFHESAAETLVRVTSARVPLPGSEIVEVVAFRPGDGGVEHLAIVVGEPSRGSAVPTRLHSECFTGDLLESLRCDCGTQLRAAVDALMKEGGGVLLYLAQEGRGIGLINKLRAYRLQDQGFDTYDANARLGFAFDERFFESAARMLELLGISRVRLLTNNPGKVEGLRHCGIDVVARVPHAFPATAHNAHYLDAKARRAGHVL